MEPRTLSRNQSGFSVTTQEWFEELDYVGSIELLNDSLLALFSSAKCPARLILKAHDYAKEIKDGQTGIISGFHAPAEKEILEVGLKGSCPIVVVLGRRLEGARIPAAWKAEIEKSRMLVISPFKEYETHVTKEMSLKRNDLAARIAGSVLIVHASEGGRLQGQAVRWVSEGVTVSHLL